MPTEKNFARKTVNRLRAAQDELLELRDHVTTQASKWLKVDAEQLHVALPIPFTTNDDGRTTIPVTQDNGAGGEITHAMPLDYLFATDEQLDEDYRKFQELKARFAAVS